MGVIAAPRESSAPARLIAPARQKGILALAWPSLVENLLLLFMGMASLMMVGRLGSAAMAGVGVANQVSSLLLVVFSGLAVGNTALVARAVGGGHAGAARAAARQALLLGLGLSAALVAIGLPAARHLLGLLGAAPEVVADGTLYLRAILLAMPLLALTQLANGTLRGAGDTRTTLLIGGASMWGVRLTLASVFGLALGWGVPGIWIGWCADWWVRGLAFLWAFRRGRWQKARI